mmetsp:Transcript_7027/g.20310  ORF Transcript_7027/g.20310 Transcript_7027/m.20310 type:complete len:83 (-) Transcript_7027:268-516(-)
MCGHRLMRCQRDREDRLWHAASAEGRLEQAKPWQVHVRLQQRHAHRCQWSEDEDSRLSEEAQNHTGQHPASELQLSSLSSPS